MKANRERVCLFVVGLLVFFLAGVEMFFSDAVGKGKKVGPLARFCLMLK